jgi:hypothetical protein
LLRQRVQLLNPEAHLMLVQQEIEQCCFLALCTTAGT